MLVRRLVRLAGCLFFAAAAVGEVAIHRVERSERAVVDRWVRAFTVDVRRPGHRETIGYAISSSEAAELAGDAAVRDALGAVRLGDLGDVERQRWIDSIARVDDELTAAAAFTRASLRLRPGWSNQAMVYGQIEYARSRRSAALGIHPERWLAPMRAAALSSPADREFSVFAANAVLDAWEELDGPTRASASPMFAIALHDARFAAEAYGPLSDRIGADAAARLLPDEPRSIAAAVRAHAEINDAPGAARLYERWQRVERATRSADLERLAARAELNDVVGLRSGCRRWAAQHSPFEFDDADGRKESGRVLELWPPERGSWRNDPRSAFVAFFLERDGDGVDGSTLRRTAASLADIPQPLLARAELLGGEAYAAERRAEGADSAGGFEWTPFYVALARDRLRRNDLAAAADALGKISKSASDECDVVLTRAAIERAHGREVVADPRTILSEYPAAMWSRTRAAICVDPAASQTTFAVSLELPSPALVAWGFDGGRSGARLLPAGPSTLDVPLGGRSGRHIVTLDAIAGEAARVEHGTLK